MKIKQYKLNFLIAGMLLLQGGWLSAQEYLDLWRSPNTDNFYLIQQKANEYFANRDKGQGSGYKQFKRWEYLMAPRVYPSGKLISPAKLALDEELRYQGRAGNILSRTETEHTGYWQPLGITYYQTTTGWSGGMGRVNCIVPHPSDPQTLYAGTPAGGIWKTTTGGNSWISLSDGLPFIGVSGIAVNPAYTDSIYILTGDGDGHHTGTWSTGVLLSVNGGDTWQSTGLQWNIPSSIRGYKLLMHPTNRKILFAVTNAGIYKTTDGGITWNIKQAGEFTDLAFNPDNPSSLYAVTKKTFYTSTNAGDTWNIPVGAGLPDPATSISNRIVIGVTPANSDYVYLLFGSSTGFVGLYRSVDRGQSFTLRSNSPNILGYTIKEPYDEESQSYYDLAIAVSPIDENWLHMGGINCWKSMDGGSNWSNTSFWFQPEAGGGKYTHADIHALVFRGNTLYCASDGGAYFSNDNADHWTDISSGLVITQYYGISSPPDDPGIIYGGTQDNGVNKWTAPDAIMYHQVGADGVKSVVDYTAEDTVYAFISQGTELFVTEDGGATAWQKHKGPSKGKWVTPLIMHPTDHNILYAGYNVIYRITDLGKIFTPINTSSSSISYVALAMSTANPSYMYAAKPGYLKLSVNVNTSVPAWNYITGTLPVSAAEITDVTVSAVDAAKAWVTFSGYSNADKVYQTSNAGDAWTNISGTLPNVPVNCIAWHNNGKDGLYIGTDIGVFYKDNTMTDWIPFRNGMPNVIITDLEITNDKIRAATFGRGIWESDLYGNCEIGYILSGDVTGYQFFEATDGIISTCNIMGGIGTNVQYKAGNLITLNPGFKVAPQGGFLASIGSCDGMHVYRSRQYRGVYEGVMPGALGITSLPDSLSQPADRLKVYPNPFSRQSTVEFYIAKQTAVTISLWDLSGKMIKVLFKSQKQSAGNYQVRLDAAGLSSGGYLVRLEAGDYQETKKVIITK